MHINVVNSLSIESEKNGGNKLESIGCETRIAPSFYRSIDRCNCHLNRL